MAPPAAHFLHLGLEHLGHRVDLLVCVACRRADASLLPRVDINGVVHGHALPHLRLVILSIFYCVVLRSLPSPPITVWVSFAKLESLLEEVIVRIVRLLGWRVRLVHAPGP